MTITHTNEDIERSVTHFQKIKKNFNAFSLPQSSMVKCVASNSRIESAAPARSCIMDVSILLPLDPDTWGCEMQVVPIVLVHGHMRKTYPQSTDIDVNR